MYIWYSKLSLIIYAANHNQYIGKIKNVINLNHSRIEDREMQLYELFDTYGEIDKKNAKEFEIFYDFKPHDAEEPILFALGMYSLEI
jgi:hypothetical protein